MLNKTSRAMKYLLFIFNLVFVLTGISLITVGLIIRSGIDDSYKSVLEENLTLAPNLLIFIGCFVFVVSFFGCCGALQENFFMIFTFSVIMGAIFVAELTIGVTGYMIKAEATESLTTTLSESMKLYNTTEHPEVTQLWDNLQEHLDCCGTKNYTDWKNYTDTYGQLPMSCCKSAAGVLTCTPSTPTLHKTSCLDKMSAIVKENGSTIGFTGLFIAVFQLLGVTFSCKLAHSIRHNYVSV